MDDPLDPHPILSIATLALLLALVWVGWMTATDEADAINGPTDAPEPVSGYAPGGG